MQVQKKECVLSRTALPLEDVRNLGPGGVGQLTFTL